MARVRGGLWHNVLATQIYGANTGVGKTVFSTLLGAHFGKQDRLNKSDNYNWAVRYIKPVSTGPADEADDNYVHRYSGQQVKTLFKFQDAVSPHVAARGAAHLPKDEELNHVLFKQLKTEAFDLNQGDMPGRFGGGIERILAIVETAGGVLSPAPSGTPQADVFRPLRLPAILVGDHRLGGIASTISAVESLKIRGYDIEAVVCFDDRSKYENAKYLTEYFQNAGIATFTLPWIPDLIGIELGSKKEGDIMQDYYISQSQQEPIARLATHLISRWQDRRKDLLSAPSRTMKKIWHPFTQHQHVRNPREILVFDSAYGDYFQVKKPANAAARGDKDSLLFPAFDGSASWWTQGLGHGNPKLALEAAYAAGRYGHVMFAGATHEPALTLAENILKGLDNPRLERVFYTDNGSTATEVALKMGLRASCDRFDWVFQKYRVGVIGLKGSYHGDTIGAMDASQPCIFNKRVDWYKGRGYWFSFPTFSMKDGKWIIEAPSDMEKDLGPVQYFERQDEIFDIDARLNSEHAQRYETFIKNVLARKIKDGIRFGALIIEPVVLGAGGMMFVDPLFQHILIRVVRQTDFTAQPTELQDGSFQNRRGQHQNLAGEPAKTEDLDRNSVRKENPEKEHDDCEWPELPDTRPNSHDWRGLPVIFDEVFTGLYRLGRFSSASFIKAHPDISAHAKLLTGGLLPLSITTASASIFNTFRSPKKSDALLHGHSYTAHAVGCHVANTSLAAMKSLSAASEWNNFRQAWTNDSPVPPAITSSQSPEGSTRDNTWSMWSKDFVTAVSNHASVTSVNALGSVFAASLNGDADYTSDVAIKLRDALLEESTEDAVRIHSRVLGNVIYLMASMTAKSDHLKDIEKRFLEELHVQKADHPPPVKKEETAEEGYFIRKMDLSAIYYRSSAEEPKGKQSHDVVKAETPVAEEKNIATPQDDHQVVPASGEEKGSS